MSSATRPSRDTVAERVSVGGAAPSASGEPRLYALVPCAGSGSRAQTPIPKQYARVAGGTVVAHTLAALRGVDRLSGILVALSPGDDRFADAVPTFRGAGCWTAHCGGDTRAATVAAGLKVLREHGARAHDWVLVHDAARCLLQPAWVDRLIDACIADDVGGLLALPLADTLKDAAPGEPARIASTLDRTGKWVAQTPQMFRLGALAAALEAAGAAVTDEASALEAVGRSPLLVPGDWENFKVTWPGDFALAERLLGARVATASALPDSLIQAMVPAREFSTSLAYYRDLGCDCLFEAGDVAGLSWGGARFLLQDFYEPAHAGNFVMHRTVADLDAAWAAIVASGVIERYGVRAEPPAERPWGLRDGVLFDPTGVLWRIAELNDDDD